MNKYILRLHCAQLNSLHFFLLLSNQILRSILTFNEVEETPRYLARLLRGHRSVVSVVQVVDAVEHRHVGAPGIPMGV